MLELLLKVILAWLLADFLCGVIHWWQDRFLGEDQPLGFLRSMAEFNDLHHNKPTAMTRNSGWINMKFSFFVSTPIAFLLWALGMPIWLWLACFFCGYGNLVHRWAHLPKRRLNVFIRWMQRTGLFISRDHHAAHHRSMKGLVPKHLSGYRFCPMTNWVNPILDSVRFWAFLEFVLDKMGIRTIATRNSAKAI
jgi:plasmanylethanolamine desaturase